MNDTICFINLFILQNYDFETMVNETAFEKSINIAESMLRFLRKKPDIFKKILAAYLSMRSEAKTKKYDGIKKDIV